MSRPPREPYDRGDGVTVIDDPHVSEFGTETPGGYPVLRIVVYGTPAPQGSKRAFVNQYTGKPSVRESSDRVKPWREAVKQAALDAITADYQDRLTQPVTNASRFPLDGPLHVTMRFYLKRPKGHYGTGRNAGTLKPAAPRYPAIIPDLSKLIRATEDALTDAGAWADDARVVMISAEKQYDAGRLLGRASWSRLSVPGAVIEIVQLPSDRADHP